MPVDREQILLDNLRSSLSLNERALVWAMTAASALGFLTLRLTDQHEQAPGAAVAQVEILHGRVSVQAGWGIALLLVFVLGCFGASALRGAELILERLEKVGGRSLPLEEILLFPSLLTNRNRVIRLGAVLFGPIIAFGCMLFDLGRTWDRQQDHHQVILGLVFLLMILMSPYLFMVLHVASGPFGHAHRLKGTQNNADG